MKAMCVLLVLALSVPAWADDAPVLLKAGDPAPASGVLLPDALAVRRAQELKALRVENEELAKSVKSKPEPWVVVLLVAAGVVAGGLAGYGIAKATEAPK